MQTANITDNCEKFGQHFANICDNKFDNNNNNTNNNANKYYRPICCEKIFT